PVREPSRELAARLVHHPAVDRRDQTGVLGDRDELVRGNPAKLGTVPPQQGLDGDRPAARQRDDGLVRERELARPFGEAQRALDVYASLREVVVGRVVAPYRAGDVPLRKPQRDIRVAEQRRYVGGDMARYESDADRDHDATGTRLVRLGERFDETLHGCVQVGLVRGEVHRELIAAGAGGDVAR